MKILLDEHLPRAVVETLRNAGHDILWAAEAGAGMPDEAWLSRAIAEERLIISADKGFAARAYRLSGGCANGFLLLRCTLSPDELARSLHSLLTAQLDMRGRVLSWDGESPPRGAP